MVGGTSSEPLKDALKNLEVEVQFAAKDGGLGKSLENNLSLNGAVWVSKMKPIRPSEASRISGNKWTIPFWPIFCIFYFVSVT